MNLLTKKNRRDVQKNCDRIKALGLPYDIEITPDTRVILHYCLGAWDWYVLTGFMCVQLKDGEIIHKPITYELQDDEVEENVVFYGFVTSPYTNEQGEFGEFSINELKHIHGFMGMKVEREYRWPAKPTTLRSFLSKAQVDHYDQRVAAEEEAKEMEGQEAKIL